MKKYILKKVYPKSPKLGSIITQMGWGETYDTAANYPEFWEEFIEYPKVVEIIINSTTGHSEPTFFGDNHSIDLKSDKTIIHKIAIAPNHFLVIGDKTNYGLITKFEYLNNSDKIWVTCIVPEGINMIEISYIKKITEEEYDKIVNKFQEYEIINLRYENGECLSIYSSPVQSIKLMNERYLKKISEYPKLRINKVKRVKTGEIFKIEDELKYGTIQVFSMKSINDPMYVSFDKINEKNAYDFYLLDDFKVIEENYKILSFEHKTTGIISNLQFNGFFACEVYKAVNHDWAKKIESLGLTTTSCLLDSNLEICRVKRLSDGVVFRNRINVKYFAPLVNKFIIGKIEYFLIDSNNTMKVKLEGYECKINISDISSAKFLFKTVDGEDIYETSESVFLVDEDLNLTSEILTKMKHDNKYRVFKNEKDALNYIDCRKLKYSILDMNELLSSILSNWTGRDVDKEKIIDQFVQNIKNNEK